MNILIISAPHPYKVAGTVAYNLYKGLKEKGHLTKLVVRPEDAYVEDDIFSMQSNRDLVLKKTKNKIKRTINKLIPVMIKTDPDYCVQDLDETIEYYKTTAVLQKANIKPDIILYIFPGNLLNAKNLYELNKITGAPVFWYLMDSAALTGGCHYSWDCMRYKTGCGKCPAFFSNDENDQTAINYKFKQEYLSKTDISIIGATEWQSKMARESGLFKGKTIHKILLTADPDLFNRTDKHEAKKKLSIPANKKVIFFGSADLSEKRKGMKYLATALNILKQKGEYIMDDILLLVAGNRFDDIQNELPFEHKWLGLLQNNEQLATSFQAADIFVCPSIEDSGPMMINQALMCGIPVVSFEMGVSFDLVIPGSTGYIAKLKDTNDLALGISNMLSLNEEVYEQYSKNCRQLALQSCTPEVQIEKFEKLFAS